MKLQAQSGDKKARQTLNRMRGSLKRWLHFRRINDAVATGRKKAKVPTNVAAQRLPSVRDWELEQRLAQDLYTLLSEVMDPRELPDPRAQGAAVQLAEIVVAGKLPDEAEAQNDVGVIWLWPLAIVVGFGALVIMSKIGSDADVAMEKERLECIKTGACTDYGFWLKWGGIAVGLWVVWDKFELKEQFKR